MDNTKRKIVALSSINVKTRSKRNKKLKKWTPVLSWEKPDLTDAFWNARGYGQPTEEDFEFIKEQREASLAAQNEDIDRQLEALGVRIQNINAVRNQKEVRIRL